MRQIHSIVKRKLIDNYLVTSCRARIYIVPSHTTSRFPGVSCREGCVTFSFKMSWDGWLPFMQTDGANTCSHECGIFDPQGNPWAKTPNCNVSSNVY